MDCTYEELAYMHLMYVQAKRNGYEARRLYHELYANRRLPLNLIFTNIDRRFGLRGFIAITIEV